MKVELSKRLRSAVHELASTAHEREMRILLNPLAEDFAAWRTRKKDTWALLDAFDRFSVQRRRLSERFQARGIAPMVVAYALVAGILTESEVPAEVLAALEKPIAFYRDGIANGMVNMREEDD
jgi:hypothetical protein